MSEERHVVKYIAVCSCGWMTAPMMLRITKQAVHRHWGHNIGEEES